MQGVPQHFEWQHKKLNGALFDAEVSLNMVELSSETYLQAVVRDITDRKKAEKELYRLRNYLTNILDSMPSVLVGVDAEGRVTQWNKKAEQTTGIAASTAKGKILSNVFPQMVSEMEKISESIRTREAKHEQKRPRLSESGACYEDVTVYPLTANGVEGAVIRIDDVTERVRLEEMMVQSEKMLSVGGLAATDYDFKKHYDFKVIEITKQYADKVPPVPCEGTKIQQVLLNILRNGAQAMQAAGTGKPRFIIRTRFKKEHEMVCMEIEDNGPGMDEATRKRVFEPFFTTKPPGVGTGLGLSVSYFIITENHGGTLAVESMPNKGAKFIVRLPVERGAEYPT